MTDMGSQKRTVLCHWGWIVTILVVIDRFSKYGHFLPLAYPYTASKVAQMFLTNIFKLHGMPTTRVRSGSKLHKLLLA
jgi:hypothetical protein